MANELTQKGVVIATTGIITAIIIIAFLFMSVVVVPAGHVGVHDLFGNVDSSERFPGIQLKHPFASVKMMSVRTNEYTMSIVHGEGAKKAADQISALTKEGLNVDLDMTVLYRLTPTRASEVYKSIGLDYVSVIVRPQIRTVIREVIAEYEAKQIYSVDRQKIAFEIFEDLEPELAKRGIILERVLLRNVNLPESLTTAIKEKLIAEQNIEKRRFEVDVEIEEARRKEVEAFGIANATNIIRGSLSPEYLTWYWIENLDTHNSVIYVPVGDAGIPLFKEIS